MKVLSVAVAVDHLPAVPVRVVEALTEVHGRLETQPAIVERTAIVIAAEVVIRASGELVRLVDRDIARAPAALGAHGAARQIATVLRVIDGPPRHASRDAHDSCDGRGHLPYARRLRGEQVRL